MQTFVPGVHYPMCLLLLLGISPTPELSIPDKVASGVVGPHKGEFLRIKAIMVKESQLANVFSIKLLMLICCFI